MSVHVSVPGKLILIGEYAVLEGADALVASVNRYVNIDISGSGSDICEISSNLTSIPLKFTIDSNGNCIPKQSQSAELLLTMNFALKILSKACSQIIDLGFPISPFLIRIDTSQFYSGTNKLGLGSSSALTIALLVSIVNHLGIEKEIFAKKYDIFHLACDIHFKAQGNKGSGIDIAAGVFGGINVYNMNMLSEKQCSKQISNVPAFSGLLILPIWSGVSSSTRKLLSQVEEYRFNHRKKYEEMMSRLSTLSNSGCVTYAGNNLSDFLDIIADYYKVLMEFSMRSQIPIISDIHQKVAKIVYGSGGIYKPSGAGGGDIGIAFSDSEKIINNIVRELTHNNIQTLELGISETGVIVEN